MRWWSFRETDEIPVDASGMIPDYIKGRPKITDQVVGVSPLGGIIESRSTARLSIGRTAFYLRKGFSWRPSSLGLNSRVAWHNFGEGCH
jgi:hypothetical protein